MCDLIVSGMQQRQSPLLAKRIGRPPSPDTKRARESAPTEGFSGQRREMRRSRGGLTSKIHAVVDTNGLPVRLGLTAGEVHDSRLALKLLSRLRSESMLLADRAYDADWIRAFATEKGSWANVPPRSNRRDPICLSPHLNRARKLVERFFNKIKQCRQVAKRTSHVGFRCVVRGPARP